MPGHIGGKGFNAREFIEMAKMDITETVETGDLHVQEGIIEESRLLLSEAFGAKESLFLVNGASSGIHVLFLALTGGQKKVLIPRNTHRSFYAGMVFSGAVPVYVPCQIYNELGIAMSIKTKDIIELLKKHNDIEAIFLTSPNYFGVTCNIAEIVENIRKNNKKISIFVDEAHGGHFPFHNKYPKTAMSSGADAVVNGLHKTLPVLNQGACLHARDEHFFWDRIFPAWSLATTSSPSFPVLASIDLARSFMMTQGESLLERALQLANEYKYKINTIKGLSVFTEEELINIPGTAEMDPLKLLISVKNLSINGYQVSEILRNEYGIQVEIENTHYIMAMISMFHTLRDWEQLYEAVKNISRKYQGVRNNEEFVLIPPETQLILAPREAFIVDKQDVEFSSCKGKISGEMIIPYPPGIPCLLPGELIDENTYEYLEYLKENKIKINGPRDCNLNRINIIDQ